MTVTRLLIAFPLSSLIFISSCDDSPTGIGGGKTDVRFPNAIGMLWKYQVYDSLSQTTDTVWRSITDTVTVGSFEFITSRREKHFADNVVGSQQLRFRGDTLEFSDNFFTRQADERIVFPLHLGSGWTGLVSLDDTSTVARIGQIEVPAGRFGGAARIDRTWGLDFEGGGNWSQTWVAPDVGMAHQRRRSQFSTGGGPITVTTNEVWELIEWDLMTFGLDQFPNQVGAEWVYEQIDSTPVGIGPVMVVIDTVAVTIVGSGRLESGDSYTMWNYVTANGTDTQYVVTGEERLSFQSDKTFNSLWDIYYYFPLAVGRTWGLEVITPFPDALDKEPVLTPVQRFASSFHVRMSGGGFESSWTQDDWLAPGVGIIKSRRWQFSIGPWMRMNRTRTLISYRPAN